MRNNRFYNTKASLIILWILELWWVWTTFSWYSLHYLLFIVRFCLVSNLPHQSPILRLITGSNHPSMHLSVPPSLPPSIHEIYVFRARFCLIVFFIFRGGGWGGRGVAYGEPSNCETGYLNRRFTSCPFTSVSKQILVKSPSYEN